MELQQILNYLNKLIPSEEINEKSEYFTMPTICHNHDYKDASNKLYLYKNSDSVPLFHCYTDCGETFNIYQLIQKYYKLRGEDLPFKEAYRRFHGKEYKHEDSIIIQKVKYDTEFKDPLAVKLPEYTSHALDIFYLDELHPWAMEGVDLKILNDYQIGYSKSLEQVSIPHYDWRGRLIGIRVRNYNQYKIENYKYMPFHADNTFYSHPLSLNLYGIFNNQTEIKKQKRVYIYEAEKSVLFHQWIFENNLALATCGKNLSKWQSDTLIYFLKTEEVIIGFDKEYHNYNTAFDYVKKIEEQTTYLRNFVRVGVLIDENHVFREKESPIDKSKSDFLNLKIWWLD